jgi:hypothetical protein
VLAIGKYASFSQKYLFHAKLTHASHPAADPATSYTSMRIHSTCTRTLPQNTPAGISPQMSISPLQVQTAPQSACPSEVGSNLVMNAVNYVLNVCLIRRSLRQVQDAKVSCTRSMALMMTYHTCRGRKVTSLGVLYDFTGNDHNTTVQNVEDMVKEAWVSCISLAPKGSHLPLSSLRMQSRMSPTFSFSLGTSP